MPGYDLKGRNVLVTGGSRGLGAEVCRKFAAEGANVAINYVSSEAPAKELAKEIEEQYSVKTLVLKGDGGIMAECSHCVQETIKAFGGLDVVICNAGWTRFSDFNDLESMSDEEWDKCWHTNVLGVKRYVMEALPTFKQNPEGGVVIITSSIAAERLGGSSMPYCVTKAAQVHLMKCLAVSQGEKLRINAVLPGLLLTDWGNRYGDEMIAKIKDSSALKIETKLSDCADMYVSLATNTSVTGQNFTVDSGLNIANM